MSAYHSAPAEISSPQSAASSTAVRPLRTWPALALVTLLVVMRFGPTLSEELRTTFSFAMVFGPGLCSLLILIWWLTASRARWKEKALGFAGVGGALLFSVVAGDPSMRGPGTLHVAAPLAIVAFALTLAVLKRRNPGTRTGGALLAALLAASLTLVARSDGMSGAYLLELRWRWSETAEAQLLARRSEAPPPRIVGAEPADSPRTLAKSEWPGFRGADRASRQQGPKLATDWTATPPKQLWKISVGPAWSSFAMAGELLYTQEQRGPKEVVVCLESATGREVWTNALDARFYEALGGAGPRATPTLAEGGVFVTGATGIVRRLDPATGALAWQQDLKALAGREPPMWGFAASPLVTGGLVIVHAGGAGDKGLFAFDAKTGAVRWSAAAGDHSYSTAQLGQIVGEPFVLMLTNEGLRLHDPLTGAVRLNYEWKFNGYRALQPQLIAEDTVLLPTGMTAGTRAVRITRSGDRFSAEEQWTSRSLKPDFNDFVTYQDNAYGFDGGSFVCVDLKTGERRWKGGLYGKGQVLLLESMGLLLVLSEKGRAVLVRADPGAHAELTSFAVLEGKTWNHPVLVGDRLYVRNAQEAACYQLPLDVRIARAAR